MVWTTRLSSKGQLILPKAVSGAEAGSKLMVAGRKGDIELRASGGDILSWYGALTVGGPQDWDSVKRESAAERAREVAGESEGD